MLSTAISRKTLKRKISIDTTHTEPKATEKAELKPSSPSQPDNPIKKMKKLNPTKKKPDAKISAKTKTLKKKKMPENIGDNMTNILNNEDLVKRFRSVPMSNNQKGL